MTYRRHIVGFILARTDLDNIFWKAKIVDPRDVFEQLQAREYQEWEEEIDVQNDSRTMDLSTKRKNKNSNFFSKIFFSILELLR